jgi:hypothetical protein
VNIVCAWGLIHKLFNTRFGLVTIIDFRVSLLIVCRGYFLRLYLVVIQVAVKVLLKVSWTCEHLIVWMLLKATDLMAFVDGSTFRATSFLPQIFY